MPYSKTTWVNLTTPINATNLNKVEQGISDAEPHRGTTAPTSPVTGKLWEDTNTTPATLKAWTGTVWETVSGAVSGDLANTTDAAKGDALVGVKRTTTGAVGTTLHAKFEDAPFTPEDFGAVGDGVADDTSEIQAALDNLPAGAVLEFPSTYKISSTLTVKSDNVTLRGSGAVNQVTNTAIGFTFDTGVEGVRWQNLTITGVTSQAVSSGVTAIQVPAYGVVENCTFSGWHVNISCRGQYISIRDNLIQNAIGNGQATGGGQGYGILIMGPDCKVTNNHILNCERVAVYVSGNTTYGGAVRAQVTGNTVEVANTYSHPIIVQVDADQPDLVGLRITNNFCKVISANIAVAGISLIGDVIDAIVSHNTFDLTAPTSAGMKILANDTQGAPVRVRLLNNTVRQTQGVLALIDSVGGVKAQNCEVRNNWTNLTYTDALITDTGTNTVIENNNGVRRVFDLGHEVQMPTGAKAETFPRTYTTSNAAPALTSGRLWLFGIGLRKGTVVTTITFVSGTTAMVTPSNQWFALYSRALARLGTTNDNTTTAWGTSFPRTLTLSTPYTVPQDDLYYVGIVIVAATPPSLSGIVGVPAVVGSISPALALNADTGLTTPATAPATATLAGAQGSRAYAYVS